MESGLGARPNAFHGVQFETGAVGDSVLCHSTHVPSCASRNAQVIDEDGYDMRADLWSLGITAIEMAEGSPPHSEVHPMRAMFMIPTSPAPRLKEPDQWTADFRGFLELCLVKDPEKRAQAEVLANHDFITKAGDPSKVRSTQRCRQGHHACVGVLRTRLFE
jgi:serine/threonine kinase 3